MDRQGFQLDKKAGYFRHHGVEVMAFDDIYPEGHQSGVSVIMHNTRVATNGDIRFEPTPGQWQPVPKLVTRDLDEENNTIAATLRFPDPDRHLRGQNPMIYPDFEFEYRVTLTGAGSSISVSVDLDRPIPERFAGKLCFNLELFPGDLFGQPWLMDGEGGIFPRQPNGPLLTRPSNQPHAGDYPQKEPKADPRLLSGQHTGCECGYNPIVADDLIAAPYAVGKRLIVRPDDPHRRLAVEAKGGELKLYDGRLNHNNGWFVVSSEIAAGMTKGAVQWTITPNSVEDWMAAPVIQISQLGYHPDQEKVAVIELDRRASEHIRPALYKITANGADQIHMADGREWGTFLRYRYLLFDFSDCRDEGLFQIKYGAIESSIFRIARDVYERGVWQPVLEYFLPVQMCHMLVKEKYRIWHGLCHMDDARMAPTNINHFDGYVQGPSTLTAFAAGDAVPGLDIGGWHDAGDYDLRVESQAGEAYILAMAYEAFGVDYDATTIDQGRRLVEIHQPDGKNDILQQVEHGALSVVGAYQALGRLYRGIIESDLRQYVLLGDAAAMTDGVKGNADDRWVFTEDRPWRELQTAAQLACISRVLRGFNDPLAAGALAAAEELFADTAMTQAADDNPNAYFGKYSAADLAKLAKIHAAAELFLTTGGNPYKDHLLVEKDFICSAIEEAGWIAARVEKALDDRGFSEAITAALPGLKQILAEKSAETPYGIPYRPFIWGAGWGIQRMGFQYFYLHRAWPELFGPELVLNALNFILGCHPGANNASFASGVGSKSMTCAYGINRADWSYIPGGVVSGTALIRPDFPELLDFPFLWQQTEYVLGGGSSHYMFLVLAVREILGVGGNASGQK